MEVKLDSEQEFEEWATTRDYEIEIWADALLAWRYQQQKIDALENKLAIAEEALEAADIDMGLCYGYIISRIRKFNRKDDNMSLTVSVFKENITEALAKIREEKIK
jgi:hypothetical protein